jgi:NAD(P)-dependent dehydrogenase (short-subunit alcohol dehydrogenase family)
MSTGSTSSSLWIDRLKQKLVATTGYPPEMLEVELDLEADLGVDSVQRAEIWVSLTAEHGLDASVRPTGARTIAQLAEVLAKMSGSVSGPPSPRPAAPATASSSTAGSTSSTGSTSYTGSTGSTPSLFSLVGASFDRSTARPFACRRVLAVAAESDAVAVELKKRLAAREIAVDVVRAARIAAMPVDEVAALLDATDTVVYLGHAAAVETPLAGASLREAVAAEIASLYATVRALVPALEKSPKRVIFPVAMDGAFGMVAALERPLGAFPAGFVRCLARELPQCAVLLVDAGAHGFAGAVEAMIDILPGQAEWGLTETGPALPRIGAIAPSAKLLSPLGRGDLVLVTGGARGVVFECVMELARRTGCRLLLTGRTELPMGRPDWLDTPRGRIDAVIRDMEIGLVKEKGMKLPEAKRIGATVRAQWELSQNLDAMEAAGIEGRYERCDVTDAGAFAALIRQLAAAKEIVRGVVHGAGVQRSKLVTELTDAAIAATVNTKLDPVFTMLDALDWSKVTLFSAFGSIAGLFGNAGQTDYGLANDVLAWLVTEIGARYPHVKAQTVEWTAWTGAGMVTDEEAKRFAQSGLVPLEVPMASACSPRRRSAPRAPASRCSTRRPRSPPCGPSPSSRSPLGPRSGCSRTTRLPGGRPTPCSPSGTTRTSGSTSCGSSRWCRARSSSSCSPRRPPGPAASRPRSSSAAPSGSAPGMRRWRSWRTATRCTSCPRTGRRSRARRSRTSRSRRAASRRWARPRRTT